MLRVVIVMALCCLTPGLSGCVVGHVVGAAVDVTASAATAAVKVTGAAVKTTVDVVTPDGHSDAKDKKRDKDKNPDKDKTAGDDEEGGDSARIDLPRP